MSRIKRRKRVRVKLPCEIVQSSRQRAQARVVTLSEGGLAVVTKLSFDQGDSIRLVIYPDSPRPIEVSAIVWNERTSSKPGSSSKLKRLGCVVSDPSRSFSALLEKHLPPEPRVEPRLEARPAPRPAPRPEPARAEPVPVARSQERAPDADWSEPDLPRSRELQPPPKLEAEETLPYFRVRMKQIGGPRTRIMTVRARSASQAEQLAHDELEKVCKDSEGWGVLHISRVARGRG